MKKAAVQYRIANLLKGSGKTLCAAESCTGGQIAHLITMVSGSSEYFLGSVTSYAVRIKEEVLGIDPELIKQNGVVSEAVAAAMAEGVKNLCTSTYSVSTTGLAEGGDDHFPEGTVCIGVSSPSGTFTRIFQTNSDRKGNIRRFANAALNFLEEIIINDINR